MSEEPQAFDPGLMNSACFEEKKNIFCFLCTTRLQDLIEVISLLCQHKAHEHDVTLYTFLEVVKKTKSTNRGLE